MFITFKEFVQLKETDTMTGPLAMAAKTATSQSVPNVMRDLTKMQTMQPPQGSNPQLYRAWLQKAKQMEPVIKAPTAQNAIKLVQGQQAAAGTA